MDEQPFLLFHLLMIPTFHHSNLFALWPLRALRDIYFLVAALPRCALSGKSPFLGSNYFSRYLIA
jgi:hypothetical protein